MATGYAGKNQLKGLIDRELSLKILVTGSARLDVYKKGGDSLLGRYEQLRMHPLTVGELVHGEIRPPPKSWAALGQGDLAAPNLQKIMQDLLDRTGFPEPYFSQDPLFYQRWSARRRDNLIRQDLRDLENLRILSAVEELAILLPTKIGSPLSVNSLRQDLQVAFDSVKNWLILLDRIYFCYFLTPFSKKINRSLTKERKLYLWDYGVVPDLSARFENLVASHLLKSTDLWSDMGYGTFSLHYYRDKEKREIDFVLCKDRHPLVAIEVKKSDDQASENFVPLKKAYPNIECIQLVLRENVKRQAADGSWVFSAAQFLAELN